MFENYTETARRVVFSARLEAGQLGAPALGAEHLLIGFLVIDQGIATQRMRATEGKPEQQVAIQPEVTPLFTTDTAARVRAAVMGLVTTAEPQPTHIEMFVTREAKAAFAAASARSAQVDMLELLRGMCSPGAGPVAGVLEANGITAARVDALIEAR